MGLRSQLQWSQVAVGFQQDPKPPGRALQNRLSAMVLGGLRIKLVRWGFVRRPFYVLAVANRRTARNSGSRFEDVGWWDPNPAPDGNMHVGLKVDRIKYWLTAGAVPTVKVGALLTHAGVIPPRPQHPMAKPKTRTIEDMTKWLPKK